MLAWMLVILSLPETVHASASSDSSTESEAFTAVYAIEARIRIAYDAGIILKNDREQATGSSPIGLGHDIYCQIEGKLVYRRTTGPSGTRILALVLETPRVLFSVNGQIEYEYCRMLEDDLQRPCALLVNDSGRIDGVKFDEQSAELSRGMWRAIASVFQFTVPVDGTVNAIRKTTVEDDQDGTFVVSFVKTTPEPVSDSSNTSAILRTFFKSKHELTHSRERKIRALPVLEMRLVPSGGLLYTIGKNNELIAVDGVEYKGMHASERRYGCMTYRYSLHKEPSTPQAAMTYTEDHLVAMRRLDGQPWQKLYNVRDPEKEEWEKLRTILARWSTPEILQRLQDEEIARLEGAHTETDSLRNLLAALISHRPDEIPMLSRMMLDAPLESVIFTTIVNALVEVGSPAAQAALVDGIRIASPGSPVYRAFLNAIRRIEAPDLATALTLASIRETQADETDRFALDLLLGIIARKLSYNSMPLAEQVMLPYVTEQNENTNPNVILRCLAVLGNSGVRSVIPVVEHRLEHPDTEVRLKAISTLRFVEDYRVDTILATLLRSSNDTLIQQEVLSVMEFRGPCAVTTAAQASIFASVVNQNVRKAILTNLSSLFHLDDTVRSLIEKASGSDVSGDVRETARSILAQNSKSEAPRQFDCGPHLPYKDE